VGLGGATEQPQVPQRAPAHSKLDLVDAGHFSWEDAADQDAEIVTQLVKGRHARA
jgi:hypothetical protein